LQKGDAGFLVKGTPVNIDEISSCGVVKIKQKGYDGILYSAKFLMESDE